MPERQSTQSNQGRTWHKLVSGAHDSWRQPVLEILRYYTERTPGSMIDDRGISIVWRYANTQDDTDIESRRGSVASETGTDASGDHANETPIFKDGVGNEAYHWARRQAAEVQNHIMVSTLHSGWPASCFSLRECQQDSLGERFGIQLYPGATSFLILPRKAGRAIAVAHILQSDENPGEDLGEVETEKPEVRHDDRGSEVEYGERHEEEEADDAAKLEERLTADVDKTAAAHHLLEQYDYVLT